VETEHTSINMILDKLSNENAQKTTKDSDINQFPKLTITVEKLKE
jgi:hypothetical protein